MNYNAFVVHGGYGPSNPQVPYSTEPSKAPRGKRLDPERAARVLAMADELHAKRDGAERREAAAE